MENRPRGREKNVTGAGKGVHKRGSGLQTGPVGQSGGYAGRTDTGTPSSVGSKQTRSSGGGLIKIILIAVLLLGGGGAGLGSLLGGGSTTPANNTPQPQQQYQQPASQAYDLSGLFGGNVGTVSTGWSGTSNVGRLNTSVASGARSKRTQILGSGRDTVTIMVYMCGTDLESKSGMGTADLQEMLSATLSNKVNLLVYTGGCKQWKNNVVSSTNNQIYKLEQGGMRCLVQNAGSPAMTNPATLTDFIQYCAKNYPANRNELIFWDHGGGSLSGYGYDEKYASSGSMTLQGINEALKNAGVTFDFIGFDACLMATLENALTLTPYADYLIASEETEPGVGWYYTDWLTALSQNTSLSTLELGKKIADDFVTVCNQKCRGQKTTLSVVDLAELEKTVPTTFKNFAVGTSNLLQSNNYQTVSNARSQAREFASSSKIDQIDLVHLAYNMNTKESRALADTLLSAVKYNATSSNMTDAYGLSIYFPYQKTSKVKNAVATYEAIGLNSEYARCIQQFASMETGGQAVSGGSAASPLSLLMGTAGNSSAAMSSDAITSLLTGLLGGGSGFFDRSVDLDTTAQYLSENRFDAGALVWTKQNDTYQMTLSEEQWGMVHDLALNVFFDDGEGYIDLGLDNVFSFTENGALLGEFDGTWLAINEQPVAYYYMDTVYNGDFYTITGRVPVMLNGSRADLILVFDSDHPYGYVAGARSDYRNGETETVAKSMTELQQGDEISFLCDYYSYSGEYQDSYYLGDSLVYDGSDLMISNVYIDNDAASAMYRFTDLYCQTYWTPEIPKA